MPLSREDVFARVREAILETFPANDAEILETTSNVDVAGWDSVSQALVVMRVEQAFDIELALETAFEARTVGLLVDAVLARLATA